MVSAGQTGSQSSTLPHFHHTETWGSNPALPLSSVYKAGPIAYFLLSRSRWWHFDFPRGWKQQDRETANLSSHMRQKQVMLWLPHQDAGVGQEEEKSPASWTSTPSIIQTKWSPASIPFSPTHCGLSRPKWRRGSLPSSSSIEVKWRGREWSWLLAPGVCRVYQGAELSPSRIELLICLCSSKVVALSSPCTPIPGVSRVQWELST